jgi:hypothetical protein
MHIFAEFTINRDEKRFTDYLTATEHHKKRLATVAAAFLSEKVPVEYIETSEGETKVRTDFHVLSSDAVKYILNTLEGRHDRAIWGENPYLKCIDLLTRNEL